MFSPFTVIKTVHAVHQIITITLHDTHINSSNNTSTVTVTVHYTTHGVAILLSHRARAAWEAAGSVFQPVSERSMKIRLKCHLSYMTVLSVYAPTNPSTSTSEASSASEAFYDQLQSSLTCVPSSDMLVIMGNFNTRVGSDSSSWNSVLCPHGVGECNLNGEQLLDFCASNQLTVSNTWFQH